MLQSTVIRSTVVFSTVSLLLTFCCLIGQFLADSGSLSPAPGRRAPGPKGVTVHGLADQDGQRSSGQSVVQYHADDICPADDVDSEHDAPGQLDADGGFTALPAHPGARFANWHKSSSSWTFAQRNSQCGVHNTRIRPTLPGWPDSPDGQCCLSRRMPAASCLRARLGVWLI